MIADRDVDVVRNDALDLLDEFGFVDIVERGELCWSALGEWLEMKLDVGRRNETVMTADTRFERDDALSAAAAEALDQRTVIDRALWLAAAVRAEPRSTADRSARLADRAYAEQLSRATIDRSAPTGIRGRAVAAWRRGVVRRGDR
jgi:hypothetical protein